MERVKMVVGGIALFFALFILPSVLEWRTDTGIIIAQDTIETSDGHIWEYTTDKATWEVVQVWFNSCGTSDVTDDIIFFVK